MQNRKGYSASVRLKEGMAASVYEEMRISRKIKYIRVVIMRKCMYGHIIMHARIATLLIVHASIHTAVAFVVYNLYVHILKHYFNAHKT